MDYFKIPYEELQRLYLEARDVRQGDYIKLRDVLQLRHNEKLINQTWRLTLATWALAIITGLLVLVSFLR